MRRTRFVVATLMLAGMTSMAFAGDTKKKAEVKGEKPKASPGWLVIEEDGFSPFLDDFSTILHKSREHYRAKEEKSAGAEIDKAICWLKYAQGHAELSTAENLATAQADLMDYSMALKSGKPVLAKKLDAAFAHASTALARYHHFRSGKSMAEADLKAAAKHLMAATDLLRNAAQSANLEYGNEVVEIYDDYAPYGFWNDEIVLEKGKLEANLAAVQTELEKLAVKLK